MRGNLITTIVIAVAIAIAASVTFAPPAHASTASVQRLIRYEAARAHLSRANADALVAIAYRESTWNPRATNGYCWGLFQLSWSICQSTMRREPAWRWYNAQNNIWRAIGYIRGRYGTPLRAWQHELEMGWY
jgi:hypothetical protein